MICAWARHPREGWVALWNCHLLHIDHKENQTCVLPKVLALSLTKPRGKLTHRNQTHPIDHSHHSHSVSGQNFQIFLQFWTIIAGKMAFVGLGTKKKNPHVVIFYIKRIVFMGVLNVEKWQFASYWFRLFLLGKRLSGTFLYWVHFV